MLAGQWEPDHRQRHMLALTPLNFSEVFARAFLPMVVFLKGVMGAVEWLFAAWGVFCTWV